MDIIASRDFNLAYILLDSGFLLLFAGLLLWRKRRLTVLWGLFGGILCFAAYFPPACPERCGKWGLVCGYYRAFLCMNPVLPKFHTVERLLLESLAGGASLSIVKGAEMGYNITRAQETDAESAGTAKRKTAVRADGRLWRNVYVLFRW